MQREVSGLVGRKYGIGHATLQLECVGCEGEELFCDIADSRGGTGPNTSS